MPDPLDHLEERFAAALARPAGERAAFLQMISADDPALAAEISTLLQAYETSGDYLEELPLGRLADAGRQAQVREVGRGGADEVVGTQIGRYRVAEKIGEGGCGVVYLAEQQAPVQRRVALKIIKLGMDTHAVVARFEAERQALALMDHPNIAKVFDAGETERGRPYFVMELVAGVPLTRFCDEARLGVLERLELFIKICHAIQHAHQKGVIHRDIKPSNVLVARQDGEPVPKIIDFGIAKATEARLTEHTLITEFAQVIGTPAYMSPEQLDFSRNDIDTRSDVYALGVLLYDLLAGRTPFASRDLISGGLDEMRRRIREEEPPRPSAAFAALPADAQQATALARGTDPGRLTSRLKGELDWIVMRCLEKDRARRYPTASAVAEDVRRHLDHEPVTAAAPGGFYAVKKFARRHRTAVAAGLAFTGLLLAAVAVSTWLAARATKAELLARERLRAETAARTAAERERTRAGSAEKQAKNETARATAIADFLQNDILFQAAPARQPDRSLTVRDAVDVAARRVDWKFVDQPLVELALRETLARTYVNLGEYESGAIQYERAIVLARAHLGAGNPRTLSLLAQHVDLLRLQGRTVEAEKGARELLDIEVRTRGAETDEAVNLRHQIAALLLEQGRAAEAEPLIRAVAAAHQRDRGAEDAYTLNALNTLASVCVELGNMVEAERLHRRLLEIRVRFAGPESLDATYSMNGLASVLRWKGEFAESGDLQRRATEIRTRIQGPDHPDTLASMNNLALTLAEEGRLAEAADFAERARAARARVLGPEHPHTLVSAHNLAVIFRRLERFADAEAMCAPIVLAAQRVLGPDHPNTLFYTGTLGEVLLLQKKHAAAEALLRENAERRGRMGAGTWNLFAERALLGAAIAEQGRRAEGETLLREGFGGLVQRQDQMPAGQRRRIGELRARLVQLYESWGRPDEAAKWR